MIRTHRTERLTLRALLGMVVLMMVLPGVLRAEPCERIVHDARNYVICTAEGSDRLRLFLTDELGETLGSFTRINEMLAREGRKLAFAMNAGMYHPDRRPVGLYVEDGETWARLVTREGPGNFGMLPNGVFCIGADRFAVIESRRFDADAPACRYATQSGPMLVIDGALHPRFLPGSESQLIRNGVGVSADGSRAYFVIAREQVSFHDFALLFRDLLDVPHALYLDGNISRLHAPGLGWSDWGLPMGPVVGLVVDAAGPSD